MAWASAEQGQHFPSPQARQLGPWLGRRLCCGEARLNLWQLPFGGAALGLAAAGPV